MIIIFNPGLTDNCGLAKTEAAGCKKGPPPEAMILIDPCIWDNVTRPISRVLSCTAIYLLLPSPEGSSRHCQISAEQTLRYLTPIDVASGRVYIAVRSPALWWALTPPFHHHPRKRRQYISVALALRSPSAAVSSYPAL